jgi:flavin reductase (DIM6/NTAB) family NADH-FMN oxidoreductase RutF
MIMLNVMTPVIQLEPRSLRQLLGQYATGITVVTALDVNQRKIGMTANSFTSVSLDPPLILWNIAKSATHFEDFKQAEYFAINILNEDQYLESKHFSKSADDKFEGLDDVDEYMGIPILNKSLTTFVCRQYELHEAGDHYIIVGQIEACRNQMGNPLVFHNGQYKQTNVHQAFAGV